MLQKSAPVDHRLVGHSDFLKKRAREKPGFASIFEEGFFEKNEEAISAVLEGTGVDQSSIHQLLKLPFRMTVAVGSSEPQVQRFAKEKCALYTAESSSVSYLKRSRFPQLNEMNREGGL